MRNSESGLSATSASSEKRSCAWLCAAVTIVSPASIGDPAASGTRAAPRTAMTSPMAKTTLPACAKAALAASVHTKSVARRHPEPRRFFIVLLPPGTLLERIAQLHRADVARILVELEARCIVRVLVLATDTPARVDEIQRAQAQRQIAVAPRDLEQRDRRLVMAFDIAEAGVERPERRRRNSHVCGPAVERASEIAAIFTVVLVAVEHGSVEHRVPGHEPYAAICGRERVEIGIARGVLAGVGETRVLRNQRERSLLRDLPPPFEPEPVRPPKARTLQQDLAVRVGERIQIAPRDVAAPERRAKTGEVELGS